MKQVSNRCPRQLGGSAALAKKWAGLEATGVATGGAACVAAAVAGGTTKAAAEGAAGGAAGVAGGPANAATVASGASGGGVEPFAAGSFAACSEGLVVACVSVPACSGDGAAAGSGWTGCSDAVGTGSLLRKRASVPPPEPAITSTTPRPHLHPTRTASPPHITRSSPTPPPHPLRKTITTQLVQNGPLKRIPLSQHAHPHAPIHAPIYTPVEPREPSLSPPPPGGHP